jgi:preprotein translocase subunit Sec61beta
MSSKKDKSQMPASQAGLLTFFGDDSKGIKITPPIVIGGCVTLITVSIIIRLFPVF